MTSKNNEKKDGDMGAEENAVNYAEFRSLAQDVGEVKSLMGKMVEAINRITLLDERQQVVAGFMQKLDERMGRMETRQHEAEIAHAVAGTSRSRMESLEVGFREIHLERERDKARFQTAIWLIRGVYAAVGLGGIAAALKYVG